MAEPRIRNASRADAGQIADLLVRMKRFNGEFDPLLDHGKDLAEQASRYVQRSLEEKHVVVMVAASGDRVVGFLRAELRERLFYQPSKEGHITDFYVLPEARRKALGARMLEEAKKKLSARGARLITAEFPARNHFAVAFYHKNGFRPLTNLYASEGAQGSSSG